MNKSNTLKPMTFWMSVLFFGLPSAIITFAIYAGVPFFDRAGVPLALNFMLMTVGPLALMLVAAFVAYRLEGNPMSWPALKERFRLHPMDGKAWLWTVGLFIFMGVTYTGLSFTARWLATIPLFTPPEFLPPMVDPRVAQTAAPTDFMGVPLQGNWWIALIYLGVLFFNIFGEEFWWRGYILPRQELVHGKWTWVIHGILWTLFHVFWKWNLIMLLPTCLALSFVAQRLKNTWPGIIVHFAFNGMAMIPIVLGIMGSGV